MSVDNNIPNGWIETTLGEVCDLLDCLHKTPKYSETGFPMIRVTDVENGTLKTDKCFKVNNEVFTAFSKNYKPKIGDIVFTRVGSFGFSAIVKKEEKFCIGQNTTLIISRDIDSFFLFYYLISKTARYQIEGLASGSTQPTISMASIRKILLPLPPLPEQTAIAAILTAFDDKIELLQAQNKTLETTAQTIFKEWFGKYQIGDVLPEGWRVGKIGDLIEIKRGGSPRPIKDFISDSGYRWLKISDATATNSPFIFIIKEHIKVEGLKKTTLKKAGDLVLSNSATPGLPKFLAVDTCVHDGWMHFPNSKVSNEYLYLLFLHIRPKLLQQGSGSVFVNLKTDILRYFEIIIPPEQYFIDFDKLIKPIFKKTYNNSTQIQTLKKTRDTLLPKLMSGSLRVEEFKETVL